MIIIDDRCKKSHSFLLPILLHCSEVQWHWGCYITKYGKRWEQQRLSKFQKEADSKAVSCLDEFSKAASCFDDGYFVCLFLIVKLWSSVYAYTG